MARHHVEKCGCRIEMSGGLFDRLVRCKVHAAAPELVAMLGRLTAWCRNPEPDGHAGAELWAEAEMLYGKAKGPHTCEYEFARFCGAHVCSICEDHRGLDRCFCGWARSGGDGRAELVDMGETLDEDA